MSIRLLRNATEKLTEENDYLGTTEKARVIKLFLEELCEQLGGEKQHKMFVLYGNWGSGKSSVLEYIKDHIDSTKYKGVFFEAWHHEKDDNLALSLIDVLKDQAIDKESEAFKNLMKHGFNIMKGFAKSVKFQSPFSQIMGGVSIDLKAGIESVEKDIENIISKRKSFYSSDKEFKESYIAVEDQILEESGAKKLIVFVDDLDRCDPENVLNLLSAIKLFFTYGENTVFLCALDKKAVEMAIKTKYNDVVKSEEYLEKVFDISWNMPYNYYTMRIVEEYFPKDKLPDFAVECIAKLIHTLNFTNPRHLKKVLNKYELLRLYKPVVSGAYKTILPDIIMRDGSGKLTDTLLTLLFLILHEYYPEKFDYLFDAEKKISDLATYIENPNDQSMFRMRASSEGFKDLKIAEFFNQQLQGGANRSAYKELKAVAFFSSLPKRKFPFSISNLPHREFVAAFPPEKDDILYLFIQFMLNNYPVFSDAKYCSDYKISHYHSMCKELL